MSKTVLPQAGQAADQTDRSLANIQASLADFCFISPALAIATTTTKVKTAATVYGMIDGALVTKAATDNFWTLAGTVTNAKYNVFVLMIDASGNAVAAMGTEASSLAGVVFPVVPANKIVLGFVVIHPTGTGDFVGGTTALSDGTVVPNAVYVNTPFPFNPNVLTLPNWVA